jgi:hypothetical protein
MRASVKFVIGGIAALSAIMVAVGANPAPSLKGEVIEFGICKSVDKEKVTAEPDTPNGKRTTTKEVEFTVHTDKIPATKGVVFGFRYKVTGAPDNESLALEKRVKHPPFKNTKGEMESEYKVALKKTPKDGSIVSVEGYRFGRPEDLTLGVWTFEIWAQDKKLVSQSFTVVAADEVKKK